MINHLKDLLLHELNVPNDSVEALKELNDRASNIRKVAGDLRQEAFNNRLQTFTGSISDLEGLVSLLISKPSSKWIDQDIEKAEIEIASFARNFLKLETFASIKGRRNKRHTLGLFVGQDKQNKTLRIDFDISDAERTISHKISEKMLDNIPVEYRKK